MIQNMYSLEGLYLAVLRPITYKQTERAIYIGDDFKHNFIYIVFRCALKEKKIYKFTKI